MASDQSAVVGSLPSAEAVGSSFARTFYNIIHQFPQHAYQFYRESSKLGRPGPNGVMESVTTIQAINEKILEMSYSEFIEVEIKTVDAQESLDGGVIVLATGSLIGKDLVKKDFAQSFFLAPQDKGFFVLNDLFRYMDEDDNKLANVELANGTVAPSSFEQDRSQGFPSSQIPSAKQISKKRRKRRTRRGSSSARVLVQASSTASDQSTAVGFQPPAQVVWNGFLRHFYLILHQSPQLVYLFYQESSKLGRSGPHGIMESVTNIQAINEKILAMDYSELKADIKTVDVQESLDSMIILVTGYLTGKDLVKKGFTQSFFLAPQDEDDFFVLNDISRYLGENGYNPSPPVGEASTSNPLHLNSDAEAPPPTPYSPITEESQLAMAISASIQTAMTEGVLIDLNELDINSKPEIKDSSDGSSRSTTTSTSCVICWDDQIEGACIPCGHMVGCMPCLKEIKAKKLGCPVCRAKIAQVVRIYAV